MLNYQKSLDVAFRALADPTRRGIVDRLARGPACVSELAEPLPMSLPAVHQHLQVLADAGLMSWEKKGRVRWCRLEDRRLASVEEWIANRRRLWERRLDALGAHLAESEQPGKGRR
jgi:DNA-binding transcriptional ArsR family regulator